MGCKQTSIFVILMLTSCVAGEVSYQSPTVNGFTSNTIATVTFSLDRYAASVDLHASSLKPDTADLCRVSASDTLIQDFHRLDKGTYTWSFNVQVKTLYVFAWIVLFDEIGNCSSSGELLPVTIVPADVSALVQGVTFTMAGWTGGESDMARLIFAAYQPSSAKPLESILLDLATAVTVCLHWRDSSEAPILPSETSPDTACITDRPTPFRRDSNSLVNFTLRVDFTAALQARSIAPAQLARDAWDAAVYLQLSDTTGTAARLLTYFSWVTHYAAQPNSDLPAGSDPQVH
jgi:hypothetical protein